MAKGFNKDLVRSERNVSRLSGISFPMSSVKVLWENNSKDNKPRCGISVVPEEEAIINVSPIAIGEIKEACDRAGIEFDSITKSVGDKVTLNDEAFSLACSNGQLIVAVK